MKKLVNDYKKIDSFITRALGGKIKQDPNMSITIDLETSPTDINQSMSMCGDKLEPFKISELTKLITLDDPTMDQEGYKQLITKTFAIIRH